MNNYGIGEVIVTIMKQSVRLRYSIILLTTFTLAWMALGWIFWVFAGCKPIMPFISDLDLYQPGDTIFTLGAIGSSFLTIWFLFELQNIRHKYLLNKNFTSFWIAFNYISIIPGIIAAVACFRISYTPWNIDGVAHGSYAGDIFYGGVIWCILVTVLTFKLFKGSEKFIQLISIRAFTAIIAIVSLWQMIVNIGKVWTSEFDWEIWNESANNMQEFCTSHIYPLLDRGALWEWSLITAILMTVMTFLPEIKLLDISEEE